MNPFEKSGSIFWLVAVPAVITAIVVSCSNNSPSGPPTFITQPIIFTATPTPTNLGGFTSTPTITSTPYYSPTSTPTQSLASFTTIGSSIYFYNPAGIKYMTGGPELWMIDNGNRNLQEWTTLGAGPGIVTNSYGSPATSFSKPWGLTIDPASSNIYVADSSNNQIVVLNPSGSYLNVFGSTQFGTGNGAVGVGVNLSGTTVFALDKTAGLIYPYSIGGSHTNPTYTYLTSNYGGGMGLNGPQNLYLDAANTIYVADGANHRVLLMTSSGVSATSITTSTFSNFTPVDITVDGSGNVYVVDTGNAQVERFNSAGTLTGQFGKGILNMPEGITMDAAGNFYVTDSNAEKIYGFH